MKLLLRSTALVLAITGCFPSLSGDNTGGGGPGPGPGPGSGSGGPPPAHPRGRQTMSDVHVQPDGAQVWIVHSAVADTTAHPPVTTAHLGAYVPATDQFFDVLDTTGTLGKRILFPASDRVLYVTQRGAAEDVFVSIDAVARRPLAQRSYPGDRTDFRLSPTGRALISVDKSDLMLHLLDTASLVDQPVPGVSDLDSVTWANGEDILYRLKLQTGSTEVQRFDLRTADLSQPLAPPTVVTTLHGLGDWPAVAPDDRYLALTMEVGTDASLIAMIDLATAATSAIAGDFLPAFANDDRVIVWQGKPDGTHDLRLVDPATAAATPPVATDLRFPGSIPLRRHDLMIATSILFEPKDFLYNPADQKRTPIPSLAFMSSRFERPGHPELWMWFELDSALGRLDLTTGQLTHVVSDVDSVDYRAATDDIVIGTFDHSLRRLSMATGRDLGPPFVVADPNDSAAAFRLGDD